MPWAHGCAGKAGEKSVTAHEWPAREAADEWNPPCDQIINFYRFPEQFKVSKYWIDLLPGAEVALPCGIVFRCVMERSAMGFELKLFYRRDGDTHTFNQPLHTQMDLSLLTGFPCVLIPRAIKPCDDDLPAAVMLEFGVATAC